MEFYRNRFGSWSFKNFRIMKQILKLAVLLPMVCMILASCKKVATNSASPSYNKPPIANAGGDQTFTLPIDSTLLNGSLSSDPDGRIVLYQWSKISGPSSFNIINPNVIQTQATNLIPGIYLFELKVVDNAGLAAKDTMQVTVYNNLAGSQIFPGDELIFNDLI